MLLTGDAEKEFIALVKEQNKRYCYYVSEAPEGDGRFRICVVVENIAEKYLLGAVFNTYKEAKAVVDRANGKNFLSISDTAEIVASSIASQLLQEKVIERMKRG